MVDANDIVRNRGKEALRHMIDKSAMTRPPSFSDEALACRFAEKHDKDYGAGFRDSSVEPQ